MDLATGLFLLGTFEKKGKFNQNSFKKNLGRLTSHPNGLAWATEKWASFPGEKGILRDKQARFMGWLRDVSAVHLAGKSFLELG